MLEWTEWSSVLGVGCFDWLCSLLGGFDTDKCTLCTDSAAQNNKQKKTDGAPVDVSRKCVLAVKYVLHSSDYLGTYYFLADSGGAQIALNGFTVFGSNGPKNNTNTDDGIVFYSSF